MTVSHFLADNQLTQQQALTLINLATQIKQSPEDYKNALAGKAIAMIFEKPSLRTHVSFDIGIAKLGGHALYLGQQNGKLGERERVSDYAKNLSCYADAIVARVFDHQSILGLAEHGAVPVVNALCDLYHPCQALADFVTISEHFADLTKVKLAYVGDGNNVSNSLMTLAAILGVDFTLVCPEGHGPKEALIAQTQALATASGSQLHISHDLSDIGQQDVIYTDTWISMGDNTKVDEILEKFMPYQVNHQLMQSAGATKVMHCQPAHLEHEITTALFDDESLSVVFQQAENRMWAQSAVLVSLLS
ncbi:ornithine carbamoyltransferase [Colwellia sp. MEBiC06753]